MAPHTMSLEEYQELGRRYYKLKQYDKAIEAFSNGVEASRIPSVSLFDGRSACYVKLGDFNSAVKDGREMIKLNKRDVKGYLRTANALEKMNKLDTATNIYKYGMKNVPLDNENWKLLQQLHDKLNRQLSPAKAIDPFAVLPVELVEMIIEYLPFKNMVKCTQVSKGWKKFLLARPKLWTNFDLSGATKLVPRSFARHALDRSQHGITRAVIHRFPHTDVLRSIVTTCKSLTDLEFLSMPIMLAHTLIEFAPCASNLKKLVVDHSVTLDTVTQVFRGRPSLEHVEFREVTEVEIRARWIGPFPNLHTLYMNGPVKSIPRSRLNLASLLRQTPNLKSLNLGQWEVHDVIEHFLILPLETLILRRVALPFFPFLPSTLRHLVLQPEFQLSVGAADHLYTPSWDNALRSRLPNLTYLSLTQLNFLTPFFLTQLLDSYVDKDGKDQRLPNDGLTALQHFSINDCILHASVESLFGPSGLLVDSPRILSRELRSLELPTSCCSDDDIELLLTYPTNLQSVNLSSTRISGAGVKMLVDRFPGLSSLKVDNCPNISSRDVIDYAMGKGIAVSCVMGQQSKGGRKVRYG